MFLWFCVRNTFFNLFSCLFFFLAEDQSEGQIAEERDLTFDGSTLVTKKGRTTGQTIGILIDGSLSVCIEDQLPYGGFYYFEKCYGIENDQTVFFDEGDSGAGVFIIGKDNKLKPLGIAFAQLNSQTAVCNIRKTVEALNVSIYQNHET